MSDVRKSSWNILRTINFRQDSRKLEELFIFCGTSISSPINQLSPVCSLVKTTTSLGLYIPGTASYFGWGIRVIRLPCQHLMKRPISLWIFYSAKKISCRLNEVLKAFEVHQLLQ